MEGSVNNNNNNDDNNNTNYVDTTMAEKPVWLMKCPTVVARSFQQSSSNTNTNNIINTNNNIINNANNIANNIINNNNIANANNNNSNIESNNLNPVPVAKVVYSIDPLRPNDSDSSQFTMELTGTDIGNAPKFFSMDMSEDFAPMSVFSEFQGKISVEGKIINKIDMRPQYDAIDSYGKLCRERTKKSNAKTRQIQVIGHEKPIIPMPGIFHVQEKKKVLVKASETKRTRRDRGEMEEIMFKLFEQQPNWTLKELINKTDQPEQFMKDILKDLCVYNNKGANQGSYQLKPEYKRSVEEPQP